MGSWVSRLVDVFPSGPRNTNTPNAPPHPTRHPGRAPTHTASTRNGRIHDRICHATPMVTIYQSEQLRTETFRHVTPMITIYAAASHEATDEFPKIRHVVPPTTIYARKKMYND